MSPANSPATHSGMVPQVYAPPGNRTPNLLIKRHLTGLHLTGLCGFSVPASASRYPMSARNSRYFSRYRGET